MNSDAGIVNGRYFVNSFSVGLDADIAVAAGKMKKIPFMSGERLYYSSTLKQLLFGYHRCPWLKFSLDGGEVTSETTEEEKKAHLGPGICMADAPCNCPASGRSVHPRT